MKKITWDDVKAIAGMIGVVAFISTCSYSLYRHDKEAAEIKSQTVYCKITDKDYRDESGNIITSDYRHMVYFTRYDKEMKRIKCSSSLREMSVTEYTYGQLKVGETYRIGKLYRKR